jgi:hypothetical protein
MLHLAPLPPTQGIRSGDRSRLLALCLAALEAQLGALPACASMLSTTPQLRQLSETMLTLTSLAAAGAWLGYVPAQLLEAAGRQLAAVDAAVLQAAGLEAAAASVRQQAAAAGLVAGSSSSSLDASEEANDSGSDGTAIVWYCLDEKLQLYSSVLRLLTCSSIEQQQEAPAAVAPAAVLELPAGSATLAESEQAAGGEALASSDSSGGLARSQALLLLQRQQQQQAGSALASSVRGWRATAAGTRSESQLLSLAPAALQDMAVTAADAVAAAYLADAAAAGPSLAARGSSCSSSGDGTSSSESAPEGLQQQRRQRWWWFRGKGAQDSALAPPSAATAAQPNNAAIGMPSGSSGSGAGTSSSSSPGSGSPLEAGWWPTFVRAQLGSTRQLQRFANQVALNRWVQVRGWHAAAASACCHGSAGCTV